jgi:hypothetical protein
MPITFLPPGEEPKPLDLALGRWIGAIIVSLGLGVAVSLGLALVGLPALSPLSLLVGLACGTPLAGYLLEAKSLRQWAAVFVVMLVAQVMLTFEVIGVVTVFSDG